MSLPFEPTKKKKTGSKVEEETIWCQLMMPEKRVSQRDSGLKPGLALM